MEQMEEPGIPGEVQEQFLEDAFQERKILTTVQLSFDFEDTERSPGKSLTRTLTKVGSSSPSMNGRIDVSEVPFICGNLTIRFHVPLPGKQIKLFLGKRGINDGQGNAVERGIPRSEKWILPSE